MYIIQYNAVMDNKIYLIMRIIMIVSYIKDKSYQ